jgi:hypothetical protein
MQYAYRLISFQSGKPKLKREGMELVREVVACSREMQKLRWKLFIRGAKYRIYSRRLPPKWHTRET